MNSKLIREAADHLNIVGLHLGNSSIELSEEFNPLIPVEDSSLNLRWSPNRTALVDFNAIDGINMSTWQVVFATRAQLLKGRAENHPDPALVLPVVATLKADFVMHYSIIDHWKPNSDALQEFTLHNTVIHVWPYWREWLQSTAARIGLPQLVLGMHMLPKMKAAAAPSSPPESPPAIAQIS